MYVALISFYSVFDIIEQMCLLRLAGSFVCHTATIFKSLMQPFVLKIFVENEQRRIKVLYVGNV